MVLSNLKFHPQDSLEENKSRITKEQLKNKFSSKETKTNEKSVLKPAVHFEDKTHLTSDETQGAKKKIQISTKKMVLQKKPKASLSDKVKDDLSKFKFELRSLEHSRAMVQDAATRVLHTARLDREKVAALLKEANSLLEI